MAVTLHSLADLVQSKPIVASLALATHYILHNGDWDNSSHVLFAVWASAFGAIATLNLASDPRPLALGVAILNTASVAVVYFSTLAISVLVYRGFFHRLGKIPGPFQARFSKFYGIFAGVVGTGSQYFRWLEALHEEYQTDVIRTGPREVIVCCAEAVPLIHGPTSRCRKPAMYSATDVGGTSVQMTRDKREHQQRRKVWDHAFSAKSLREYEPRLNRHALALMSKFKDQADQASVKISDWFNFYSFDVMGDIGFNRSFGMVEKGREDDVIKLLHKAMGILSFFSHLPWLLSFASRTSMGAKPLLSHIEWSAEALRERVKTTPKERDIFSWLLRKDDDQITPDMNADSRLLVVAGSDTTSATLSFLTYELCKNPDVQAKLRTIIDAIKPEKTHLDVDDVAECAFLDGVINEALRLHPPVPSGATRETPTEGITLPNGTYIPGNVNVCMPQHVLQRDPRYWQDPLEFMPERWTDERPEAIIDKRAFFPFIVGVYNCVGQKLAMMELRSVTANLVRLYEVNFAEGEDGSTIMYKSQDCFTTNVAKLEVKLTPRYKA